MIYGPNFVVHLVFKEAGRAFSWQAAMDGQSTSDRPRKGRALDASSHHESRINPMVSMETPFGNMIGYGV